MPVITSIDGECLIKILLEEGFKIVRRDNARAGMVSPVTDIPLIIRLDVEITYTVLTDLIENAQIPLDRFLELRYKYCPP